MTALEMKQPGIIFRGTILFAQGTIHSLRMLSLLYPFVNLFLLFHLERSVRKPVFPGLPGQSQVLPQIRWIFRGRGGEDIHPLSRGKNNLVSSECGCMFRDQCSFLCFQFLNDQCIDSGKLPLWKNQLAPKIAVNYWKLPVRVLLNSLKYITELHNSLRTNPAQCEPMYRASWRRYLLLGSRKC